MFTCTGSGTNTDTHPPLTGYPPAVTNWTPPGPQTGQFSLGGAFGGGNDYSSSDVATISVTVKATWTPDGTGDDTAPPSVWLCESSSADWTSQPAGKADDGFKDTPVPHPDGSVGGISFTVPGAGKPPAHWTKKTVSGGTVTLPALTLTAEADFAPTQDRPYGDNCYAHVGSYNVTIHAQPYNWHILSVTKGPAQTHGIAAGELEFMYSWSSTDGGNITDLTSCFFHELVTYPGPNPFTVPAPFSWPNPLPNGVPYPGSGTNGLKMTDLANGRDVQHIFTPVKPYFAKTLVATQLFQFDDTSTGETNVTIPGPDASATITRSVSDSNGAPPWNYSVSKSGSDTTVQLAP